MLHNWVRQETAKIHVPSSGLKTQKDRKTSMRFMNRIRALAAKTQRSWKAIAESTSDSTAAQLPRGSSSLPSLADRTALARRIVRG